MSIRISRLWPALLTLVVVLLALPAAAETPANGITVPVDGATVEGQITVKGNANNPDFSKWQLDLLPGGDQNAAIFLALGTTPGVLSYPLDSTQWPDGAHALRLRVVRADSNYDEFFTKFVIANKAAQPVVSQPIATPPEALKPVVSQPIATPPAAAAGASGITSPKDGASVSGQVAVTGRASRPDFLKWQLDLLPDGDPSGAIFLAMGSEPGVFTYTLDTTLYPNGKHALRLRNVRQDSNYDEYINTITIANKSAAGTEVIVFDPPTYKLDSSNPPADATCVASAALPDRGAYACTTTAGAKYDPCFVSTGAQLVCPNSKVVLMTTGTLPVVAKSGSPAPFHVELAPKYPPCDVRGDLNKTLNGQPVTWSSAAPGAWLLDGLNMSQPTWVAQYVTTDSQGTKVTFGPVSVDVTKAWVY